jgi:hypothetical protein
MAYAATSSASPTELVSHERCDLVRAKTLKEQFKWCDTGLLLVLTDG